MYIRQQDSNVIMMSEFIIFMQDFNRRVESKDLEFVWRASQSLGSKADIFTGVFSHGNVSVYLSPKGFGWEWGIIKDTQQVVVSFWWQSSCGQGICS